MSDKFTILTATRNCAQYVESTVKSVLSQTYTNWEMIVSDDCSTDDTFKILSSFNDPRLIIQQNPSRLYCGANYAKMLNMATGKYCGVLDGDDMLKPEAIETVLRFYNKYPKIDFIWTKHRWCNGAMTRDKNGISSRPKQKTIHASEEGFRHVYSHWRTFKTEMRNRGVLFKDMPCTVDKELGYTLEELGRGGFLPLELYLYRYHKNNMSHHSRQKEAWAKSRRRHKDVKKFGVMVLE